MFTQARQLLGQVSQSDKMWLKGSGGDKPDILLEAAPNWLNVDASDFPSPLFAHLTSLIQLLPNDGLQGLYLGQIEEAAELWQSSNPATGVTSLQLDSKAGDEDTFKRVIQEAEKANVQLGSTLLGAATGVGPDFILQTRMAPGSTGIYAMLEAPSQSWADFPAAKNEWDFHPLDPKQQAKLADEGLLPETLARDNLGWAKKSGWAITGEINGLDGKLRRWLFRYWQNPALPVLMWNDPFGQAKRILSAAVIQKTGLQRQSLAGLHMEALMGLEPAGAPEAFRISYSPGLEALGELAAQIHRYGGWALQADAVPENLITAILAGECDFCRDDPGELAGIASLLSGNSAFFIDLVKKRIQASLPASRLARGFAAKPALRLLPTLPAVQQAFQEAKIDNASSLSTALSENERIKVFLLALRLGQPGLVFLSPAETGLAFRSHDSQNAAEIHHLLHVRTAASLGQGKLIKAIKTGKSTGALLIQLPAGGYWLTVMNFAPDPTPFSAMLPFRAGLPEIIGSKARKCELQEGKFTLYLDGLECVNVIFEAA